jgi:hypothetical protein
MLPLPKMLRSPQQPIDKHRGLLKITDKSMYKVNMSMLLLKREEQKSELGDRKLKTAMRVSVLTNLREILLCIRESIVMVKPYKLNEEQTRHNNYQTQTVRSAIGPVLNAARQSAGNIVNQFDTHVADMAYKMITLLQSHHSIIKTGIKK